jgi:hypothetical protein
MSKKQLSGPAPTNETSRSTAAVTEQVLESLETRRAAPATIVGAVVVRHARAQ